MSVDVPILAIAHELFDALPVHQFQFTAHGWKERLVDVDVAASAPVLTNAGTSWFLSWRCIGPTPLTFMTRY